MEIIVGKEIENVCPNFVGACVEAKVKNSNFSQELWKDIDTLGEEFRNKLTVDTLKEIFIAFAVKIHHVIVLLQKL